MKICHVFKQETGFILLSIRSLQLISTLARTLPKQLTRGNKNGKGMKIGIGGQYLANNMCDQKSSVFRPKLYQAVQ